MSCNGHRVLVMNYSSERSLGSGCSLGTTILVGSPFRRRRAGDDVLRRSYGKDEKQILRFLEPGGLHRSSDTGPRPHLNRRKTGARWGPRFVAAAPRNDSV